MSYVHLIKNEISGFFSHGLRRAFIYVREKRKEERENENRSQSALGVGIVFNPSPQFFHAAKIIPPPPPLPLPLAPRIKKQGNPIRAFRVFRRGRRRFSSWERRRSERTDLIPGGDCGVGVGHALNLRQKQGVESSSFLIVASFKSSLIKSFSKGLFFPRICYRQPD